MNLTLAPMTPRQSRLLAPLLLLAVFALGVAAVAIPALQLNAHYQSAIDQRVDRLTREQRIISMAPKLQQQMLELQRLNPARFYLRNPNPVLAAAEIQEDAKRLIDANGGKLLSMNILPPKDEDQLTRVGINVQLTGGLDGVEKLLYGLETAVPYLFINNLNIRSINAYIPPNAAVPPLQLQVQFDLTGYVRKKGAA
ncbi:MAG: type II secretion system protein GspM [Thiomonas sp.]|uniref:type II secretion system protein GspM n=1 Tax=unclassified Thiomonas TaxID=2625466 RepID=UPI0004DBB764|nr:MULTISPECIES: type II secretion system protein GspM [unclassified Thiomonas]MDD4887117.1 type II secretion system protein GspM [Thiomonas sp.]CDW92758.1 putative General secretion pathway protein M [Thiomonas sp. CB2]VDY05541.1 putative General secretion pathway protein M [Thiomonas sp. Bio17B3]VDY07295.1 putative General secretion pathway protein M [Thiomonas sp. Sup16B3]VDY13795.1 putative General secretion pathway protein M [Thiomonas sp. OC7]